MAVAQKQHPNSIMTASLNRILSTIALFAFSAMAMADTTSAGPASLNQFSPPPGDTSVDFLSQIFGNIVNLIASGGNVSGATSTDVLSQMMSVFCSGALFLAMVFVAYTTIVGTINSAHDGEMLGRKMSEVWVPIRTVTGIAFLLPLGSGYCLIQIGVLWCALHGVGLADAEWNVAIQQISKGNMIARPIIPDARPLAANILRYEVCAAAMNKQYADSGRTTKIVPVTVPHAMSNTTGSLLNASWPSSYQVVDYKWRAVDASGNPDPSYMNSDVCGGVSWKESWESSRGNASTQAVKTPIMSAHVAAVNAMISELNPVALQIVAGQKPAPGAIDNAANNYVNTLQAAAQNAIQTAGNGAQADFLKAASSGGWLYAGTWYNQIVKMNDTMQSTINALPTSDPITIIDGSETQEALQNFHDAMAVMDEYSNNRSADVQNAYYQATDVTPPRAGEGAWEYIKRLLSAPFMGAINQITTQIGGSNLNHMSQMKSFGDTIISTGEAVAIAISTAAGFGSSAVGSLISSVATGGTFNFGASIQMLAGVSTVLILGLLGLGAMLSTYVPMIPYIIWTSTIVNWFILVIVAVMAAPIWAAAHVHPDGDDVVGKGGQGYMMILNLIIMPTLMVFGLFFSMLLTEPVTGFINTSFMSAVSGVQADSMTGIVSFLAYVTIYVIMMTSTLHGVFSLIHYLPVAVPRWIGSSGESGPVSPDQKEGEAKNIFAGGVQTIKTGMGQGQNHNHERPGKDGSKPSPTGFGNKDLMPD